MRHLTVDNLGKIKKRQAQGSSEGGLLSAF